MLIATVHEHSRPSHVDISLTAGEQNGAVCLERCSGGKHSLLVYCEGMAVSQSTAQATHPDPLSGTRFKVCWDFVYLRSYRLSNSFKVLHLIWQFEE